MEENIKIEYIDISEIKYSEYNPRKSSEEDEQNLKNSIEEFGLVDPIIVNSWHGRKNIIIGGHFRVRMAKELGYTRIPVVFVEISNINKEKELNIRLNKNSGEFDFELLANFDESMLLDIGFKSSELDKVFPAEVKPEDDEIPENVPPICKLGDIWILGSHRVMCGDSTSVNDVEKLMDGKKAVKYA